MLEDSQLEIEALAHRITCYLTAHPRAADTLEGITKWWLARQRYQESMTKVQKALDYLVKQQLISRIEGNTGHVIYSKKKIL